MVGTYQVSDKGGMRMRSEKDILMREAERCWLEGLALVNKGTAQMQRAYSLREKAWDDASKLIGLPSNVTYTITDGDPAHE